MSAQPGPGAINDSSADFSVVPDRRNTGSLKWEVGDGELPMWVADMDFPTAPAVRDAVRRVAEFGVFGYATIPPAYARAVAGWWSTRHGWGIQEDWIALTTGVVPAISSLVRSLTAPGDSVVVLTPVYNIFFNSILNSGRNVSASPLLPGQIADGADADGNGSAILPVDKVDWKDLESRLADPSATLLIMCNPQNPTGTLWDATTLAQLGELCARHGVRVVSDEIHCDITEPGTAYTPFATASETCARISVTCVAPTKAFNIAGLQTAAIVVPDRQLRELAVRGINRDEVAEPNVFAVAATIAAFEHGGEWLDQLRAYLFANKRHAADIVNTMPGLTAYASPATYLLWTHADRSELGLDSDRLTDEIRRSTGLVLSSGRAYGASESFLRMNIACPRVRLDEGLSRLRSALDKIRAATPTR